MREARGAGLDAIVANASGCGTMVKDYGTMFAGDPLEADARLVELAGLYADRLSANIELPRDEALGRLAPEKDARTIRKAMGQVRLKLEAARPEKKDRKRPPALRAARSMTRMRPEIAAMIRPQPALPT